MYCSGCGTELESDLNYCNRCGSPVAQGQTSVVAENLSSAVGYIGGFGFLGFAAVLFFMVKNGLAPGAIVPISFFYLAALFGVCFMILRQTAPMAGRPRRHGHLPNPNEQPAYLRPLTTAQLSEPRQQPVSVAENTTRALDEIPARPMTFK